MTLFWTAAYLIFLFCAFHFWGKMRYSEGWVDGFETRIKNTLDKPDKS